LCSVTKLDLRRRAIEIERSGAEFVDISAVDNDALADELWPARFPGQTFDAAILCQPLARRNHHDFALGIKHWAAVRLEQRHRWQSIIDASVRPHGPARQIDAGAARGVGAQVVERRTGG